MNKKYLAIIGAGGHGKVVADCAQLMQQWDEISFYDDKFSQDRSLAALEELSPKKTDVFVAIGDNHVRETLAKQFQEKGFNLPIVQHPKSVVAQESVIGNGTVLMAGTIVNPGATIGEGCILNTASSVDHDCTLGNYIHVAPGARLAGTVSVEDRSWIGIGSVICENRSIGNDVIVGAGAVVVHDIVDHKVVKGVPAK